MPAAQQTAAPRSALKDARLHRKLCKMLGLKRDASAEQLVAEVQRWALASRSPLSPGERISGELAEQLAPGTTGENLIAQALRLRAELKPTPRGVKALGGANALVTLTAPLQALRDRR